MASIDQINGYHDKDRANAVRADRIVGFNACPWHGAEARVPLITPENFEKVLRYIKKRNDDVPANEKTWHQKLFMMATWNEYGEGTYIMPARRSWVRLSRCDPRGVRAGTRKMRQPPAAGRSA